jgi:hypothetical protein
MHGTIKQGVTDLKSEQGKHHTIKQQLDYVAFPSFLFKIRLSSC